VILNGHHAIYYAAGRYRNKPYYGFCPLVRLSVRQSVPGGLLNR